MMRRSLMMLSVVVLAVALVLPAMAQGGPGGPPPPGAPGPGPAGPQGGMMGGMMDRMGGMMSSPPVIAVAGDYVYVAWMGMLTQYKADDLTVVKSVQMPMPERMRGMGRDGGGRGGRGTDRPEGAPPPPPANP